MSVAPAPNRSTEVAVICSAHPVVFSGPVEESDTRRRAFLLSTLIPALNSIAADEHNWGYLIKDDQAGKIPPDIIVWRPTMEHFDVMTDTGGVWIPKGVVTNPAWRWGDTLPYSPAPTDTGDGQGGQGGQGTDISVFTVLAQIAALRADVEQARQQVVSRLTTLEAAVNSHIFTAPDYEARVFGQRVTFTPVK